MAHILLAEDDKSMRTFLAQALDKGGHSVICAEDGLEALKFLKNENTEEKFDLLLTDIVMPGMDGIELSQKASQLCPNLKVMFITGFAAVAVDKKSEIKPGTRVLSKPFHLKELVTQIDNLLAA